MPASRGGSRPFCVLIFVFAQNGTLLIGTSTCEIVTVDITAPGTSPTVFPAQMY